MNNIKEIVTKLSDNELIENLKIGNEGFKDGVYQVYIDEANSRGISKDCYPVTIEIKKSSKVKESLSNINVKIKLPIIFKLWIKFMLLFIALFILSSAILYLMSKPYFEDIMSGYINKLPLYLYIIEYSLHLTAIFLAFYITLKKSKKYIINISAK